MAPIFFPFPCTCECSSIFLMKATNKCSDVHTTNHQVRCACMSQQWTALQSKLSATYRMEPTSPISLQWGTCVLCAESNFSPIPLTEILTCRLVHTMKIQVRCNVEFVWQQQICGFCSSKAAYLNGARTSLTTYSCIQCSITTQNSLKYTYMLLVVRL